MIQHYELLYIIQAKFTGEELEKIQNKIKEIIQKAEGQINYEQNLGKKKLAYPIKRNFQGLYIINEFDIEADKIKTLNEKLKLTSEILRHLIVKKKKLTEEERELAATKQDPADRQAGKKESQMTDQFKIEKQLEDKPTATETKAEKPKEVIATEDIASKKKDEALPALPAGQAGDRQGKQEEAKKPATKKDDKIKLEDLDKKLDEIIDSNIL